LQKELLRLSGQAILLVAGIGLLAAWPSYHWGGSENLQAMLAAGVVTLIASVVSLIPITIAAEQKADWLGQACLGATVIRLMVTLAAGMGWYLAVKPSLMAFALWTMLFYLVLLAWETKTAMGYIKIVYERKNEDKRPQSSVHS
jgi:hypothetical protein